ncbi:MAG: RtcB family protein [Solirubrobacteraceae bacterium]
MITIYGEHDQRTIEQLERCVAAEEGAIGALMPDGHLGYSMPIGGVVAYRDHLSPSGVGYDIGCGNKAVLTNIRLEEIDRVIPDLMDEIVRRISFGVGRANNELVDHPMLGWIAGCEIKFVSGLVQSAAAQLGTVGSGNHYVDLFHDEQNRVWVGCHFGSRGFGHKIASHYLELASGGRNDNMDAPPALIEASSLLGQEYLEAMELAGVYAYAGRDVVCDKVLEILGAAETLDVVHNHHNFAWREEHFGETFWVVRKGATPAAPGQRGFVGGSMGECSVILRGRHTGLRGAPEALYSTVHGAGRAMSRTQAAGKFKRVKRDGQWVKIQKSRGEVNWPAVQKQLREQGIHLRGGAADEAPIAYKRLHDVLAAAPGIEIEHVLTPIGVAMAGADTYDPYKD